jgi:hypothetical protein
MAIDRMLEEELKEEGKEGKEGKESSLPYARENTAHFAEQPEQPKQPATSRFSAILPSDSEPDPILANFNMPFRDTKSQCF